MSRISKSSKQVASLLGNLNIKMFAYIENNFSSEHYYACAPSSSI
jgi:hypothetical protein